MYKDLVNLPINILNFKREPNWLSVLNKSLNKRQLTNNTRTNNLVKRIAVWKKKLHNCVSWEEGERMKQNVANQTYLHIYAPTNPQYKSQGLMTGNNNVCKTIWKKGNKKEYNEKYICCFFTIWILRYAQ